MKIFSALILLLSLAIQTVNATTPFIGIGAGRVAYSNGAIESYEYIASPDHTLFNTTNSVHLSPDLTLGLMLNKYLSFALSYDKLLESSTEKKLDKMDYVGKGIRKTSGQIFSVYSSLNIPVPDLSELYLLAKLGVNFMQVKKDDSKHVRLDYWNEHDDGKKEKVETVLIDNPNVTTSLNGFGLAMGTGIGYKISDNISAEIGFDFYNNIKLDDTLQKVSFRVVSTF